LKIDNIIFDNREEATKMLYSVLPKEDMIREPWIVLAISTGGVPIALDLAKKLNAQFDYLFTKKIFTKNNNECEIAIITETQDIVVHEELLKSFSLNLENIYNESKDSYLTDIQDYKIKYRDGLDMIDLANSNVLLVDEGLNTGLTMMACIKSVISKEAKSICVAVPVLPEVTINDIETIADDLYFVQAPAHFVSIDFYYKKLEQIELEDIKKLKDNYKKENNVNSM